MISNDLWVIILVIGLIAILFCIGLLILLLTAHWKIFTKAGKPGWAALVPFYNGYTLSVIVFGNASYFVISLVLNTASFIAQIAGLSTLVILIWIATVVLCIIFYIKLSKAFGKSGGFIVGMIFLPYIFQPILGFGKSEYIGPQKIFK